MVFQAAGHAAEIGEVNIEASVGCRDGLRMKAREEICRLANDQRRIDRRLGKLSLDTKLTKVAQSFAADMARRQYFSHDTPEGKSLADRANTGGIKWRALAENIAVGYKDPEAVMEGWMNSNGHKNNILGRPYGRLGVGVAKGKYKNREVLYWVQVFAD